ncbi:hypothetical protein BP6252_13134 [Coleophoma cylindrospora]|uniref:Uncharacterized protein n=1 Tax=Coleophoma cylindrospora TaxID=1849047 RepID=A0A3D8QAL8_9HELO|nr:hypothetical protein BP6252_13134 [Coleophoma cylindrospora]
MVGPSQNSINREAEHMVRNMKTASKGKDHAVIGVLRSEAIAHVNNGLKLASWKKLFGKKQEDYPLLVTSVEELQKAIETIRKKFRHCEVLTILVSTQVDVLYRFVVGSRCQTLQIFRCGSDTNRSGRLLIAGDSTFNRISIDEWQGEERNGRRLLLGDGVGMTVNSRWRSSVASSVYNLNQEQQEELKAHLEAMRDGKMHKKWWKQWKGPVAAILGLMTTTGKIVMGLKVSAGGAYVSFNCAAFSLQAGGGLFKTCTVATVMGPAVLLGVGVAAAVYFIPWGDLISWIGSLVSYLSSTIWRLWEGFLSWWNQWQEDIRIWWSQQQAAQISRRGSRPM